MTVEFRRTYFPAKGGRQPGYMVLRDGEMVSVIHEMECGRCMLVWGHLGDGWFVLAWDTVEAAKAAALRLLGLSDQPRRPAAPQLWLQ